MVLAATVTRPRAIWKGFAMTPVSKTESRRLARRVFEKRTSENHTFESLVPLYAVAISEVIRLQEVVDNLKAKQIAAEREWDVK